MALNVGELVASIGLDDDEFGAGLSNAEGDFDKFGGRLEASAKRVAGNAGKALGDGPATGARKYGDAIGSVGDKADATEQRVMGAKDTIDGAAAVMKGPGADGMSAYLQGWADLASGVANFIVPAVKALATTGMQTVATVAHTVASKAAAVGAKAWAATQWLLNAALTANPIGLVVVGIAALIAIIVIAWKRSETFRTVVTGALNGVLAVAKAVGSWFTGTFWPWLRGVWDAVSGAVGTARNKITGHLNALVKWLGGIPGRIGSAVSGAWSGLTGGLTSADKWVRGKVNDLVKWLGGLPARVGSAVSGMFDGIRSAFRSAINWVIGKWNDLQFSIPGVDTHIPGIGTVGGFTLGTPNIPYLAKGGTARRGGLAVVGERGAEVVRLGAGDSIFPTVPTAARGSSGSSTAAPTEVKVVVELRSNEPLLQQILTGMRREVRAQGGNVQLVLGKGNH